MSLSTEQINVCKKGILEDILSLIKGCDINNVLPYICKFGHLKIVKYLVEECGADVRAKNDEAVRGSSICGHLEVVKYLVEKCGADARVENDEAVRWASGNGYLEIVKYLVEECGADVRAKNDEAVRGSSVCGHLEVVKYLVEKCGADVRIYNDYAVRMASVSGHFEIVKYLVEKCGAVLPEVSPKYERYLLVYEKGEKKRRYLMAKKIYFWWVQMCYNPDTLCGQRSMYKGYREYLNMC